MLPKGKLIIFLKYLFFLFIFIDLDALPVHMPINFKRLSKSPSLPNLQFVTFLTPALSSLLNNLRISHYKVLWQESMILCLVRHAATLTTLIHVNVDVVIHHTLERLVTVIRIYTPCLSFISESFILLNFNFLSKTFNFKGIKKIMRINQYLL